MPIFTSARMMPVVRTNSAIGPFWRAKTCSIGARTFDHRPLAFAVRRAFRKFLAKALKRSNGAKSGRIENRRETRTRLWNRSLRVDNIGGGVG